MVDDVSPHHRQTQSLWRASTGSEQRSETYAKLSKLHNVWRCGAVEYGFARFANVPCGPQAWGAVTQTGFARQALEVFTNSELCLIQIAPEPKLTVPFTTNIVEIESHLNSPTVDRLRLLDAMHVAAAELRSANNVRRAILILSDSRSLTFRFDQLEARDAAAMLDVPVYSMNLWQPVRDGWYPIGPAPPSLQAELQRR